MKNGEIVKVSGPLVVAKGMENANIQDICQVGSARLIGEIIEMRGDMASIQVYEETTGVGPGEPVETTGEALSVELGPGLLEQMFDGIQRPLDKFLEVTKSDYLTRGVVLKALDRDKKWEFVPVANIGDELEAGDIVGTVQENIIFLHKIIVPYGVKGKLKDIKSGSFSVDDVVYTLETADGVKDFTMVQKWPVRRGRPFVNKLMPGVPMLTGQRIIDTLFPVAKGGTATVPGPFGAGKTVIQHQIAKWSDVDIVVYVGCGERGNEMTDVIMEFPELKDPRTGESLMKRTTLIANTSNMPVAAREASIYTGITIAEYFRDMGYSVAIMADSTSRWAEALREMSGRLEEMPGDEGYPAYLGSRVAEFYERAGRVIALGKDKREGSITAIGAVSPPGGDTSEPVSQNTLRVVKVFWGLDSGLAQRRHFPAINWHQSYSLYNAELAGYYDKLLNDDWSGMITKTMALLTEEASLEEIVRLIGFDSLSEKDKLKMEIAKIIREDYLQQNSFDEIDSYASLNKQHKLIKLIMAFSDGVMKALDLGAYYKEIIEGTEDLRFKIARAKFTPESELEKLDALRESISDVTKSILLKQQPEKGDDSADA